ncbi:Golgi phosphoprotein 3 (GPP34) [Actinopolyspora mzabensis]|uniref:Golgi phosphoprotein 3 (GPP34) n=1 Tax=Actinopolyspora mzabensis TaxID=995066 RepID=A0A1G9CDW4_ACTMZ|nr:GPP34 family phosphoprotein [Actinopolyspora mzabensis]SDK49615.1 Golgi phosphoprotein 3 (GPP34) [Actinopolyspora mzabensis]
MPLAERLLLLTAWADEGGTGGETTELTLAGAELLELVLAGRVNIRNGSIRTTGSGERPTTVLEGLAEEFETNEPIEAADWIGGNAGRVRDACLRNLTDRGLVHEQRKRRWGFWPVRQYVVEPGAQQSTLDELREFATGSDSARKVVALAELLRTAERLHDVLPEAEAREVARRLDEHDGDTAVHEAIDKAVEQVRLAVQTATTAGAFVAVTNT